MVRKPTASLLATLLLSAMAAAQEPWKSKPYTEWTAEEVRRVLDDSPWARVVTVDVTWSKPGEKRAAPQPTDMRMDTLRKVPQVPFLVRWSSTRAVRMALARHSMLTKGAKVNDAEKFLERVPAEHEFFVTGPDLTPLRALDSAALKACATLQLKSSKVKIAASGAEFRQKQADEKMEAVVFHFPKNDASGRPLIPAKESGVEFVCKAGGAHIKAGFEPGKMVHRDGPEF